MYVLSIKVAKRKKSGNLFNDPRTWKHKSEFRLLVIDKNKWNNKTSSKLLVLDGNTWNQINSIGSSNEHDPYYSYERASAA